MVGRAIELENGLLSSISSLNPHTPTRRSLRSSARASRKPSLPTALRFASLTAHWDPLRFTRGTTDNQAAGFGLKATVLRLSSKQCAAYFGS